MEIDKFLGQSFNFWIEVKEGLDKKGTVELIQEIADLRSKVSFYESRINQLSNFMQRKLEVKDRSE